MPVFLTGATGYVGGRLHAALRERGEPVRALSRSGGEPRARTRQRRLRVGRPRGGAVVGRGELSPHLASRQEVGRILRASGVPTIELRASVVIGRGSVSYDAFSALAALPLAVLPDWIDTASQPIAAGDVVAYLLEAATVEVDGSAVFEIGGADRVPYRAILEALGGTAATVPAPGFVASLATALEPLQPERARIVSDLLDSLRVDTSVADDAALEAFSVRPRGLAEAVAAAQGIS